MLILHTVTIFLRAKMAESGPPLGTILGNLGINTIKFCKEFNDFTLDLPNYFKLRVSIIVFENKTFSFSIRISTVGFILSLLKINDDDGDYLILSDLIKLT